MNLEIDRNSPVAIYNQIAMRIEEQILSGELSAEFKLPSERKLAAELKVHRNTVIKAYHKLINKELVIASQNPKGYFIKSVKNTMNFGKRFFPPEKAFKYECRWAEKTFNKFYWESENKNIISFSGMVMPRNLNSVEGMHHIVDKIFNSRENDNMSGFYRETKHLKQNICNLLTKENIYVTYKNIQILSESNQIISYLMMLYMREGDCIVAETPMVPDVFSIFYNMGVKVISIPMEEDGMNMQLLEEALDRYNPKFIYTQPNYHNPTGLTMSLKKRKYLLKLANDYNIPIIEEDYQKDFTYNKEFLPSLYSLDTNRLVIYVYSFTLIFPYMMKIGYAVGPSDLIAMMEYAVSIHETAVSGIGQYFLNEYIESGGLDKHIKIVQKEYKNRLEIICGELDKIKKGRLSYIKPKGGLIVWCKLDKCINERLLCKKAKEMGVLIMPGNVFYENDRSLNGHIRLCFSNTDERQIKEGIYLLGCALDECGQS